MTYLEQKWTIEREEASRRLAEAKKACKTPNSCNRDKAYWCSQCEHGDWNMLTWADGLCPQCKTPASVAILDPNRMIRILSDGLA